METWLIQKGQNKYQETDPKEQQILKFLDK